MKFVDLHPFADPDAAARKLIEIANGVEAVQDGRIYIERVNEPFLAAGVVASNSAPGSSAPLRSAGYCGMRAAPT
jgi:hypothetical protein